MEGNGKKISKFQISRFKIHVSRFMFQDAGQTLMELLLALGIFAFIMTAVFALVFGGLTTGLRSEEQDYATMFAQEGLDAARSIRDTDWDAFIFANDAPNTHGIFNAGSGWAWGGDNSGTNNETTVGARKYTREIIVENAYRDASNNIFTGSNSVNFDYANNNDYQCEGGSCPSTNIKVADGAAKLNGSVRVDDSVNPKELTADSNTKALYHFNSTTGAEANNEGVELAANTANAVGIWHMNGTLNTSADAQTVTDSQTNGTANNGTGNDGATNGTLTYQSGKFQNALSFDGVDDYVDAGDPASVDFGAGDFTLEAWVKLATTTEGNSSREMIISKDDGTNRQFFLAVDGLADNLHKIRISYFVSGSQIYADTNSTAISDTNWHHVAGIRNGSNFLVYVDGVSLPVTTTGTLGTMNATSAKLVIGGRVWPAYPDHFPGSIDEVAVYNTALTQAQITDHYRRGIAEDATVNETAGNTFGPNDGNTYGPVTTAGNTGLNQALSFNGTNDFVMIAHSNDLEAGTNFSVEAWFINTDIDQTTERYIVSKYNGGTNYWKLGKKIASNGDFGFKVSTGSYSATALISGQQYNDNEWHHAVGVKSGTDLYLYIDGNLAASGSNSNLGSTSGAGYQWIGYSPPAIAFWKGSIDEVAIWNKALTQQDIWDHIGANSGYTANSYATVKRSANFPATDYANSFKEFAETATIPSGTSIDYQLSTDNCVTMKYWDGNQWTAAGGWNDIRTINRYFSFLTPAPTICLSARLNTTNQTITPVLDNVEIKYSQNRDTAATLDDHTKKITSRVKWNNGLSLQDISLSEYLTDWNYNSWTQTTYNDFTTAGYSITPTASLIIEDSANPTNADSGLVKGSLPYQWTQTDQGATLTGFNFTGNGSPAAGSTATNTQVNGSGAPANLSLSAAASSGDYTSAVYDTGQNNDFTTASWTAATTNADTFTHTTDAHFNGTNASTMVSGTGTGAKIQLYLANLFSDGNGTATLDLSLGSGGGGCAGAGLSWAGSTCTIDTSTYNVGGPAGTYEFTTINVPLGTTLTASGNNALIIKAKGDVTVAGTVSVKGGNGVTATTGCSGAVAFGGIGIAGGKNGGAGACGGYTNSSGGKGIITNGSNGVNSSSGTGGQGGGAGGGYSGSTNYGGGGGNFGGGASMGNGTYGGAAGLTYGTTADVAYGGSGGGGGRSSGTNNSGGGGGAGGGAIKIITNNTLSVNGSITAKGGIGGNKYGSGVSGGGGGGSGGSIWLMAKSISISGSGLDATGGAGGTGSYAGGTGGAGRIRMEYSSISGSPINPSAGYTVCPSGCTATDYAYAVSGAYTSAIKEVGSGTKFGTVSWTETLNGQTLTMKARSCDDADCSATGIIDESISGLASKQWANINSITNGSQLSGSTGITQGDGWVQYEATLSGNGSATPTLDSVTINTVPLVLEARAGNVATPDGTWTAWTEIGSGATSSGSLGTTFDGNQYIQYRANFSTTNTSYSPSLDDITINYQYYPFGVEYFLVSSKYDTGDLANAMKKIQWTEYLPAGGDIQFQIRSSNDGAVWTQWCGPIACDDMAKYTDPYGAEAIFLSLADNLNDRWFQYKAILTNNDPSDTPILKNAQITYELADKR